MNKGVTGCHLPPDAHLLAALASLCTAPPTLIPNQTQTSVSTSHSTGK